MLYWASPALDSTIAMQTNRWSLTHYSSSFTVVRTKKLLGQSHTTAWVDSNSPFTITDNSPEYTPYSHNNKLHQWLQNMPNTQTRTHVLDDYPPPPLLYNAEEIAMATTTATTTYHHYLMEYLTFTKWCTTTSHHPTMRSSHPLNAPVTAWNTYSPQLLFTITDKQHTLRHHITEFRNSICLQPSSVSTSHPFVTGSLSSTDTRIMTILDTYKSPLILTIDGPFKPLDTHHIYPPHQPQHPTFAHTAASITSTVINNSHLTTQWMDLPSIPLLLRVQPLPAAYDTNNVTNNTAELLVRVMACDFLPENTPAIVIYDSCLDIHIPTDNGQERYFQLFFWCLYKGLKRPVRGSQLTTQHTAVTPPITMIPHPHSWTRSWTKFAYYLPVVNHGCHTSTLPQYTRLSTLKLSPINCDQMDTRNIMPDPSHVWPSSTAITRLTKHANCPLPQTRSNHIPYAVTRHVSPPLLSPDEYILWPVPCGNRRVWLHGHLIPGRNHYPSSHQTWDGMVCPQHVWTPTAKLHNRIHGSHSSPHYTSGHKLDTTTIKRQGLSTSRTTILSSPSCKAPHKRCGYRHNKNMPLLLRYGRYSPPVLARRHHPPTPPLLEHAPAIGTRRVQYWYNPRVQALKRTLPVHTPTSGTVIVLRLKHSLVASSISTMTTHDRTPRTMTPNMHSRISMLPWYHVLIAVSPL